jgi:uncharacterized protein involved in tolerance to divalent cations
MITLKICSPDKNQIQDIAQFLLENRLALDLNFLNNLNRLELVNNSLQSVPVFELHGKTKAVLFQDIDNLLKKNFSPLPEIYSVPIVHMDWEQSKQLAKRIIDL